MGVDSKAGFFFGSPLSQDTTNNPKQCNTCMTRNQCSSLDRQKLTKGDTAPCQYRAERVDAGRDVDFVF